MSVHLLLFTIVAIINLTIALLVLARNPHNWVNRSFSLFAGTLALWTISMGMLFTWQTMLWSDLTLFFGNIVGISTFILFSRHFPEEQSINKKYLLYAFLVPVILFIVLAPFRLFVSGIIVEDEQILPELGPLYPFLMIWSIIGALYGSYILFKKYKNTSGRPKSQLKYLFWGFFSFLILVTISGVILPALGISDLAFLSPAASLLVIGSTAYAIIRLRLMDIRLAVRAILYHSIKVILLVVISISMALLFVFEIVEPTPQSVVGVSIAVAIIVGLFYEPFDHFLRLVTDKIFFQREYSRQKLIRDLVKMMAGSIDLRGLKKKIEETLVQVLKLKFVKFELKEDNGVENEILMQYFEAHEELLVYDELDRRVSKVESSNEKKLLRDIRDYMVERGVGVALPLVSTEGLIGLILLGEKKGGEAFTSADLESLETLMYQAGVSIENAVLFAKTKRFNIDLQKEVEKATKGLEIRNRRLTILRHLDQVILNTVDINEVAQKVVNLVSNEMKFQGAAMVLLENDKKGEYIRLGAVSNLKKYQRALNILPSSPMSYKIYTKQNPENLFVKAMRDNKPYPTDILEDLYYPVLPKSLIKKIEILTNTRHVVVYSLYAKGKMLGAISLSLPKPYAELSRDEKELIEAFVEESGIAVENARLYWELGKRNEELKEANVRLKELDTMKDELVSVASHELRTPMTVIKSYLWMVLNKYKGDLKPSVRTYLEKALASSDRMITLVNDMLSVSRLEGRRVKLDLQPVKVEEVIQRILDELKVKASERNLELKFNLPKQEIPCGLVDRDRFSEILFNLIGNSIKYTNKGTVDVSIEHKKSLTLGSEVVKEGQGYIWVSIKDTGVGIAKEDMPRLFKKFGKLEQGSFTKSAETGGTGLGLYITQNLVELHGGRVWVQSRRGKGSTFTFSVKAIKCK